MKDEAARESSAFLDQKDDSTANTLALQHLSLRDEISSESIPGIFTVTSTLHLPVRRQATD